MNLLSIYWKLTRIYAQCVHTNATSIVAKIPKSNPALLKAIGIAKMPLPREAFNKCVNVSQSLEVSFID